MLELSPAHEVVLEVLERAQRPMSLKELAGSIGRSPPATLRNLKILEDRGLVDRQGRFHESSYRLATFLQVHWSDQVTGDNDNVRLRMQWHSNSSIDWRFPLVSRVPDAAAQEVLCRFLDHGQKRGYFTPWLCRKDLPDKIDTIADEPNKLETRFPQESYHYPFSVIVFGSCARGDARSGSDLDVLVLYGDVGHKDFIAAYDYLWRTIAYQMAPGSARPINLHVRRSSFLRSDRREGLAESVIREGITVYSSDRNAPLVEATRRREHNAE